MVDDFATATRPCAADEALHRATVQSKQMLILSNDFLLERDGLKITAGPRSITTNLVVCPRQRSPSPFDL